MERIHTDTYNFEALRGDGCVYVDKTDIIYELINKKIGTQFFFSRPRRFGKSLLLSTIKCIFEGKRELFDGLALAQKEWDWEGETCPVILLDMNICTGILEDIYEEVDFKLRKQAKIFGVELPETKNLSVLFEQLIIDAAAKSPTGQVVLLIDEYDKPLAKYIGTPEVKPYQEFLKSFYSVIKSTGYLQRFCLMTGVSKFSKVSIFSDLNNLKDLTMNTKVSTLLGYTHEEVKRYFPESLQALAEAYNTDSEGVFDLLIKNYDGYSFNKALRRVFNPVSLGNALSDNSIGSYWFETGTPSWLMSFVKTRPLVLDNLSVTEDMLGTFEPDDPDVIPLLFQTGYLTIKSVDEDTGNLLLRYDLGFPNKEVSLGFNKWLVGAYTTACYRDKSSWQTSCRTALATGNEQQYMDTLQSFFSSIGYNLADRLSEQAYQAIVVAILSYIGIDTRFVVPSARGRADVICSSEKHVFIIELKIATGAAASVAAAEAALTQIKEKGYACPFAMEAATGKRMVHLIGVSFDCNIHNIAAWKSEVL